MTRYSLFTGHADYPHEPGTLYDCAPCERLMEEENDVITKGQARRIVAEWQGPGNECSTLQHVGIITEDLVDELGTNLQAVQRQAAYAEDREVLTRELNAVIAFAKHHGPGKVPGWGAWDDTPVSA